MTGCGECLILPTDAGNRCRILQESVLRLVLFSIFISCSEEVAGDPDTGGDQLTWSVTRPPFRHLDSQEGWQECALLELVF